MSTEDTIQEFAPALCADAQARVLKTVLQMLGDLTGFGISYGLATLIWTVSIGSAPPS